MADSQTKYERLISRINEKYESELARVSDSYVSKIAALESQRKKFTDLMGLTDPQLRILNSNEAVLPKDTVYNAPFVGNELIDSIKNRSLDKMSPEEFYSAYKRNLYGIGLSDEPQVKERLQEESIDSIPQHISPQILNKTDYTEQYLLQECREHSITQKELNDLVDLAREYKSKLPTLFRLAGEGHTIDEVATLLLIREELSTQDNTISLKTLSKFYRRFGSNTILDQDYFSNAIDELHSRVGGKYINVTMLQAISISDTIGAQTIEDIIEHYDKSKS